MGPDYFTAAAAQFVWKIVIAAIVLVAAGVGLGLLIVLVTR